MIAVSSGQAEDHQTRAEWKNKTNENKENSLKLKLSQEWLVDPKSLHKHFGDSARRSDDFITTNEEKNIYGKKKI